MNEDDIRKKSNSICIHPFASMSIHASGHVTRCMMSEESMGDISSTKKNCISNSWSGASMKSLRSKMLDGAWDSGCRSCMRKEDNKTKSKRLHWQNLNVTKDLWKDESIFKSEGSKDIYFLDIAFNNFCNFKCRMCSSAYSSKWKEDESKLKSLGLSGGSGAWADKAGVMHDNSMRSLTSEQLDIIVGKLSKVRRIDVVGGEPFLTKDMYNFLLKCKNKEVGSSADFTVTTNGSVYDEEYLKLLSTFKNITINISIDAIGDLFSYMRSGKTISWEDIDSNITKFINYANEMNKKGLANWKVNLNGAFQTYNMLEIDKFIDWVADKFSWDLNAPEQSSKHRNSFEMRLLMTPGQLSVMCAPNNLCQDSVNKLRSVKEKYSFLKGIDENSYLNDIETTLKKSIIKSQVTKNKLWYLFCKYTVGVDLVRKQKFKDVLRPELSFEINKTLKSKEFIGMNEQWGKGKLWGGDCLMPWKAVTITGQGDVKPCCQLRGKVGNLYDGESVNSLYNHSTIQNVRKSFLKNEQSEHCNSCWEREEQISNSRRIWFNKKFANENKGGSRFNDILVNKPDWIQMDINLSNRCNLKCRMCGVWGSHKWIEDEIKLAQDGNEFKRETSPDRLKLKELDFSKLEMLIPNMSNIKRIDFKGGEPMLAKHHIAFLELLIKSKLNNQLTLHYTTNGTVYNEGIIELFNKFKKVEVVFSIEGTDPVYSYIRGGAQHSFEDLIKNIKKFNELGNIKLMANVAMQAYNLPNLKELHESLNGLDIEKFSAKGAFNCIVNSPVYLSPFVWPLKIREKYAMLLPDDPSFSKFKSQLLEKPYVEQDFKQFIRFTQRLDEIRQEDYFSIYPELSEFKI